MFSIFLVFVLNLHITKSSVTKHTSLPTGVTQRGVALLHKMVNEGEHVRQFVEWSEV